MGVVGRLVLGKAHVPTNAEDFVAVRRPRHCLQGCGHGSGESLGRPFDRCLISRFVIAEPGALIVGAQIAEECEGVLGKAFE